MGLAVNGRFLTQSVTGVQRFAREICRAAPESWLAAAGGKRVKLLLPQASADLDLSGIDERVFEPLRLGRARGHVWEQTELAMAYPHCLLLNLCGTAPVLRRKQAVVLHDAAVAANPKNFNPSFRIWYTVMISAYSRFADHLFTVSEFSRVEIGRYWRVAPARIKVIPESGAHVLRSPAEPDFLRRHGLAKDGYVLAVSSMSPNKNFGLVLEAMRMLQAQDLKLVVAGGANNRVFSDRTVEDHRLVKVGYVSDGQLRTLYENAACFVYPSLYEGFGLPPLEAMECGCPVIVSDASSLPEVCGPAALYCDPHSPASLAEQLNKVWSSAQLRGRLRDLGTQRVGQYTWETAANTLLGALVS